MSPTVEIRNLVKRYGRDVLAVNDLTIDLWPGEIYGLVGPNGAGKSTLMRVLVGLVEPTSGRAAILDSRAGSAQAIRHVGAVIEHPGFYAHLTGRDNLRVMAMHAGSSDQVVDEVLDQVDLAERAGDRFETYSMGMRQRLGLACALLKNPSVLILDEPTNGLDPEGIIDTRRLLHQLRADGRTIMVSSHLMSEIEQICDRIGIINNGALVAEGSVEDLRGTPSLLIRAEPLDRARELIEALPFIEDVSANGTGIRVTTSPAHASEINRLLVNEGVEVHQLSPQNGSIEETFLSLLGSEREGQHV